MLTSSPLTHGISPVLISFSPKKSNPFLSGVENTLPFSCYNSTVESTTALMEAPIYTNASDTAAGSAWAVPKNYANACHARLNETGGLFGTAFIARDMMKIVDALEEDGLLHYWGK